MSPPGVPSQAAARAVMCRTASVISGLSTRVRVSPVEVPAPSRMKFSGVDEIFSWVGSPQRVSSFWPVGTVNREVNSRVPPVSLVEGRAVVMAPSSTCCALAGMEARTSWWALVSTMMRRGSSPGASSTSRSEGSSRPRSRVPRVPVAGSQRRMAPL